MKYITEKVKDGVLDLTKIETPLLIKWANECDNEQDMNTLGHEICYRVDDKELLK